MSNDLSRLTALAGVIVLLAACAAAQPKTPAKAVPNPSASAPAAGAASNLKPFAEVIKDYRRVPGYLNVYQKDERWLLELREEDFKRDFLFSAQRTRGIGERWLWSGKQLDSGIGHFVRLSDRVQWMERNTSFTARDSDAMKRAVAESFSESLRGSAPILSQPDPATKALLVDLNALVLSDFSANAIQLQQTYRQPYQFDRANSLLRSVASTTDETVLDLQSHYMLPAIATGAPGAPLQPSLPRTLPDVRSLFLGVSLAFSALPEAMAGRAANPRVGYFQTDYDDFDREDKRDTRRYLINRWRLEKKDPAAALSEPRQPITYWLDRNIPQRYRETVRNAILAWNTAFEKAGFLNAIRVEDQPADAAWQAGSPHHAIVRWVIGSDASISLGQSIADPRSGEILGAEILLSDNHARNVRRNLPFESALDDGHDDAAFAAQSFAALQESFALDATPAVSAPDSPIAEARVLEVLRTLVMHEVGHTLGLRHNFRASAAYSLAQLEDPAFVARNGLASSVMDYLPLNRRPGKPDAEMALTQKAIGPYDIWAIEYGYTPFPPEAEESGLRAIAQRAAGNPLLAYGEDSEAGGDGDAAGIDPAVARQDLGQDPIAWLNLNLALGHELWDRLASRPASGRDDEDAEARHAVRSSLERIGGAADNVLRMIGGITTFRATSPTRRDVFQPLPAAAQRAALTAVCAGLFRPDSLMLDPALLRRLGPPAFVSRPLDPQPSILSWVFKQQEDALAQLFSDRLSRRLLDSATLDHDAFRLSELHRNLRRDIWRELDRGGPINAQRRMLQRAWLAHLGRLILSSPKAPADARAVARYEARALLVQLRAASGRRTDVETRAHLQDALTTLDEMLRAPLLRQSP